MLLFHNVSDGGSRRKTEGGAAIVHSFVKDYINNG